MEIIPEKDVGAKGVGILGGTFDPIHLGHLRAAEEAGEGLHLEKVYLIPSAQPPHKCDKDVAPFADRLRMTRLAVMNAPRLDVLDLEGKRLGFSYSIQTLKELDAALCSEIYFIVGVDAFLDITTWKEYRSLFDYAHFVVIQRPGFNLNNIYEFISKIDIKFKRKNASDTILQAPSGKTLILFNTTLMDISSTIIRKKVANKKSIRFLVPDSVRDYIVEKGLYLNFDDPVKSRVDG